MEDVVIVGAGPCGLAIAQQLHRRHRIDALVVDRATAPASAWRSRYDGFRLNTCGYWSHLPDQRIPWRYGRWPTRDNMVAYFDDYVRRQRLRLQLGTEITRIDSDRSGWRLTGSAETLHAAAVVVATGNYRTPWMPDWPGTETFSGQLVHSADYRNAWPFKGRDVLVVGAGNSAADIAVQLSDNVAQRVRVSIRTPPHLVARSSAGIPPDALAILFSRTPVALVDTAASWLRRLIFGDLTGVGLPTPSTGIYSTVLRTGRIPTLAEQLVSRVRAGAIEIVAAVASFDDQNIRLVNGDYLSADTVIAATGFRDSLQPMVEHLGVLDTRGHPLTNGAQSALPGLWFAGYAEPFTGPLRSFRLQAAPIADALSQYRATVANAGR
jgi:putative flavoprotein involved in K+ transport